MSSQVVVPAYLFTVLLVLLCRWRLVDGDQDPHLQIRGFGTPSL